MTLKELLPWRFRSLNNLRYSYAEALFGAMQSTPAGKCNPLSGSEVHALLCKRDLNMFLLAAKSFLRFYDDVRVVVHDDGSLTERDFRVLAAHIQGVEIIARPLADRELARVLPRALTEERKRHVFLLKLFDFNHFSRAEKTIGLDSDIVFVGEPTEVIDWLQRDSSSCFYNADPTDNTFRALEQPALTAAPNFNAGFIGYQGRFALDTLVQTIELLGYCLEDQTVYAYLFSRGEARALKRSRYYVYDGRRLPEEVAMVHFISPFRFKDGLYLRLSKTVARELLRPSVQ